MWSTLRVWTWSDKIFASWLRNNAHESARSRSFGRVTACPILYCTSVYGSNGRGRVMLANFEKLATEAKLRVMVANLGNLSRML